MAEIGEWKDFWSMEDLKGLLILPAFLTFCYLLGRFSEGLVAGIAVVGAVMAAINAIGTGVLEYWKPRKLYFREWPVLDFLFFLGLVFVLGGILGLGMLGEEATILMLAFSIVFVSLFPIGSFFRRRKDPALAFTLDVIVDGDYSLELIREMEEKMGDWSRKKGLYFKRKEIVLFLRPIEGEKISWTLEDISQRLHSTKYRIWARINSNTESPLFTEMKQATLDILNSMEAGGGLESYPQVKSVTCPVCEKSAYYHRGRDWFSCQCEGQGKKESEVLIETYNYRS